MPCEVVKTANGVAICCSRGPIPKERTCYVCGDRSEFLCDWPVRRTRAAASGNQWTEVQGTCDKRMCRRCANEVGPDRHYCNAHFRIHKGQR